MVEYSVINAVLLIGLLLGSTAKLIPDGQGNKLNLVELLAQAYSTYLHSLYLVLNLPTP